MLRNSIFAGLAIIAVAGCTQPTHDPAILAAIKVEAAALMETKQTKWHKIQKADWPPVIASLNPEFVSVEQEGVDIMVKPYFDGGYGYFVPRKGQQLPGPPERYSRLQKGIYWYRPS